MKGLNLLTFPSGNFLADKIFFVDNILKLYHGQILGKTSMIYWNRCFYVVRLKRQTSSPVRHFSRAPETRNSFATRRLYITTVAFIDSFQRHSAFPSKEIKLPWSQRLLPILSIYKIFTKTSKSWITCLASANESQQKSS